MQILSGGISIIMNKENEALRSAREGPVIEKSRSQNRSAFGYNNNAIGKKRDQSLGSAHRAQQKSNQLRSQGQTNSTKYSCSTQRDGKIPVSDFLQSFRDNGAHFISSAYL
jgi:hypothetical protein